MSEQWPDKGTELFRRSNSRGEARIDEVVYLAGAMFLEAGHVPVPPRAGQLGADYPEAR